MIHTCRTQNPELFTVENEGEGWRLRRGPEWGYHAISFCPCCGEQLPVTEPKEAHKHELRGPIFKKGEIVYLRETIALRGVDVETPTGESSLTINKGQGARVASEAWRHNQHWPPLYTIEIGEHTIQNIPEYLLRSQERKKG